MRCTVNDTLKYVISLTELIRTGDVRCAILSMLSELGFRSSSDGFGYLRKAIYLRYNDPDMRISEIYQEIVHTSENVTSVRQVEQAIFTAIDVVWKTRNKAKWDYFFSEEKMGKTTRPTNKEFIAEMACVMELWASHCEGVRYGIK